MDIRKIISLVIVGLFLMFGVLASHGQEDTWLESFDDPTLSGWEHSANVTVADGVLKIPAGEFASHGGEWLDFSMSVRLHYIGTVAISYRSHDGQSYSLILTPDMLRLQHEMAGTVVELSSAPITVSPEEWIDLRLDIGSNSHAVTLNDKTILTTVDDVAEPQPGGIAFEVLDGFVDVDLISITPTEQPDIADAEPTSVTTPPEDTTLVWVRTGGPPGGLGYDIRYNFADPNIWYVTDSFAGLFISTDNGLTWQSSVSGISGQAGATGDVIPIFCVTVDPLDPQIVWAGTQNTGHIYKSTDGGRTWTQSDQGVTIQYDALSFRGFTVDPRSSDIVYAMAETTRNDPNPEETGGIVYKTTDGGATWQAIWDGGMPSSLARYMWIDPRNPDVLYVSTGIFDRGAVSPSQDPAEQYLGGLGVLKSTDGGATWRELNKANGLDLLYIGSLYMHPDNPDILLAAAGHLSQTELVNRLEESGQVMSEENFPPGIYRTIDGGETWTRTLYSTLPTDIFTSVEMCPNHPDIAYAASRKSVYRSEDAGQTWTLVSGGTHLGWGSPGFIAGFPIDLQCDPRDPDRLFANNYGGGNFLSEDGGKTWASASHGYSGSITGDVEVDPFHKGHIYAVGRSGIWQSTDYGTTWIGVNYVPPEYIDGECLGLGIDPGRPDHLLVGCVLESILESDDAGSSWQDRGQLPQENIPDPGPWPTVGRIIFAPSDPNIVYAGTNWRGGILSHEMGLDSSGIYVSYDGGTTWQSTANDQLQRAATFDLAIDPTNAQLVYAALETGLVRTTDGGASWQSVAGLPDGRARAVAINPNDSQNILVGLEGIGVFVSTDGGVNWQPGNAGLEPNGSLHDIVFDPTNPQHVYASDHFSGVYRSTDGGHSWLKINDGLTNRAVTGLTVSPDGQYLFVATDGAGVYRMSLVSNE